MLISLTNRSNKTSEAIKILEVGTETLEVLDMETSAADMEISEAIRLLPVINRSIKEAIKIFHRDTAPHNTAAEISEVTKALEAVTDSLAGKRRLDLTELSRTKESTATALAHLQDMVQRAAMADILIRKPSTRIFNARVDPNPLLFIASRD